MAEIFQVLGTKMLFKKNNIYGSFLSVYGIGKVKAKRLTSFMLSKNAGTNLKKNSNIFKRPPYALYARRRVFYFFFNKLRLDKKIRIEVFLNIKKKLEMAIYSSYRLFQRLPQKGQRTRANAKGPKKFNPFYHLGLHTDNLKNKLEFVFKRKELFLNVRQRQLKDFVNQYLVSRKKTNTKSDKKAKAKISTQNFIRKLKTQA